MILFNVFKNTALLFVLVMISCGSKPDDKQELSNNELASLNDVLVTKPIRVGANQLGEYLPFLQGKRVGVVANQTSVIFKKSTDSIFEQYPNGKTAFSHLETNTKLHTHLVDSLLSLGVAVKKVFAPEHGFRGTADAGEVVKDGMDTKTGLPIISLYGKHKKPSSDQINAIDVLIFDIQDVGARFYTYISSLHYVMEACAEVGLPIIVLDRPNPNGHYIDGPVLEMAHKSFVGMHPVPVVHGMTIGEYAQMINGEKWLANGVQCALAVIPVKHYRHDLPYSLPINPSPNLPNDRAINLYPSLCFFEGTHVSAGRGTDMQFQIFGSPFLNADVFNFEFTPQPNAGAKYPKHKNKLCYGRDLTETENLDYLKLSYLIDAYKNSKNKDDFFNPFFTKLAGTKKLKAQIESGLSESAIKNTWKNDLAAFKKKRKTYLIYK